MASPEPAVAVVDRGGIVETRHQIHAAVVDAEGHLLFSLGDPSRLTLVRSAAKPAQALAVMETGGFAAASFDEADLALMCASHSGEDRHVARARRMLAKAGVEEGDLRCGGHPSLSDAVTRAWIRAGFTPTAVCSNCSGKHAGMLAGARALGADIATYHLPAHPLQARVRRVTAELCGLPLDGVAWAIDGCNLPTPAFPLDRLARLYGTLAAAADAVDASAAPPSPRVEALARIYAAMARHPELVAGEGRYCTALMTAFDGALVGKVGADGSYGVGVRACDATRRLGTPGAIGIAVKIEDGSSEVSFAAVGEILAQLGVATPASEVALASFHHPRRVNTMGVETGRVSVAFRLGRASA